MRGDYIVRQYCSIAHSHLKDYIQVAAKHTVHSSFMGYVIRSLSFLCRGLHVDGEDAIKNSSIVNSIVKMLYCYTIHICFIIHNIQYITVSVCNNTVINK